MSIWLISNQKFRKNLHKARSEMRRSASKFVNDFFVKQDVLADVKPSYDTREE